MQKPVVASPLPMWIREIKVGIFFSQRQNAS